MIDGRYGMHIIGAYMVEAVPFYGDAGETERNVSSSSRGSLSSVEVIA